MSSMGPQDLSGARGRWCGGSSALFSLMLCERKFLKERCDHWESKEDFGGPVGRWLTVLLPLSLASLSLGGLMAFGDSF